MTRSNQIRAAAADAAPAGQLRRRSSTASTVCLSDSSTSSCSARVTASTKSSNTRNRRSPRRNSSHRGSSRHNSCSSGNSSSSSVNSSSSGDSSSSGRASSSRQGRSGARSNRGRAERSRSSGRDISSKTGASSSRGGSSQRSSSNSGFRGRRKDSSNRGCSSQSSSDGGNNSSEETTTETRHRSSNRSLSVGSRRRGGAYTKNTPGIRGDCSKQPNNSLCSADPLAFDACVAPPKAAAGMAEREVVAARRRSADAGSERLDAAATGRIPVGRATAAASTSQRAARSTVRTSSAAADATAGETSLAAATAAAAAHLEAEAAEGKEEEQKGDEGSDIEVVGVAVPAYRWAAYLRQQQRQWEAAEDSKRNSSQSPTLPDSLCLNKKSGPQKSVAPAAEATVAEVAEAAAAESTAAPVPGAQDAATEEAAPDAREARGIASALQGEHAPAPAPPTRAQEPTRPATATASTATTTTSAALAVGTSAVPPAVAAVLTPAATSAEGGPVAGSRRGSLVPRGKGVFSKDVVFRFSDGIAAPAGQKPRSRYEGEAAAAGFASPVQGVLVGDRTAGEQHADGRRGPKNGKEEDCSERVLHALLVLAAKYEQQGEARRAHGFRVAAATFRRLCFGSSSSGQAHGCSNSDKGSFTNPRGSSSSTRFRRDSSSSSEDAAAVLQRDGLTRQNYTLLEKQRGIGRKIFQTIEELIMTGSSSRLHALSFGSRASALEQLQRVWGVGFYTAERLLARGLHSVGELREKLQQFEQAGRYEEAGSLLSRPQRLGLKYVEAFEQRIPRAEVAAIALYLRQLLLLPSPRPAAKHEQQQHQVAPVADACEEAQPEPPRPVSRDALQQQQQLSAEAEEEVHHVPAAILQHQRERLFGHLLKKESPFLDLLVCGSYRRGKPDCGDVDILLLRRDGFTRKLLQQVVKGLTAAGLLVDHLLTGDSTRAAAEGEGEVDGEGEDSDVALFSTPAAKRRRRGSTAATGAAETAAEDDISTHASARKRAGVELYCGACVWPPRFSGDIASADWTAAAGREEEAAAFGKEKREKTREASCLAFVGPLLPRRIDIKIYPARCAAFALLYFTGSAEYNRAMRLWAKRCGYSLDDTGLYPLASFPLRKDSGSPSSDIPANAAVGAAVPAAAAARGAAADSAGEESAAAFPAAEKLQGNTADVTASRRRTRDQSSNNGGTNQRSSSSDAARSSCSDSHRSHIRTSSGSSGSSGSHESGRGTVPSSKTESEADHTSDTSTCGTHSAEGNLTRHASSSGGRSSPTLPLDERVYRRVGSSSDRKRRGNGSGVARVLWKDMQSGVRCETEEDIFHALGLEYVPPAERDVFVEPRDLKSPGPPPVKERPL